MVTIEPHSRKRSSQRSLLIILVVFIMACSPMLFLNNDERHQLDLFPSLRTEVKLRSMDVATLEELDERRVALNSVLMQEWRRNLSFGGRKQLTMSQMKKCRLVFLDLGSNIGDALPKFINSFLPPLDYDASGKPKPYSFNPMTGQIELKTGFGLLVLPQWVKERITSYNEISNRDPVYPEDYCYYGVEGNPFFNPILKDLETRILNTSPRPVRHLHFLTEHVGSSIDGPTKLFLDTVNAKNHFWGSSILQSHTDVKKSGDKVGVEVTGITLTTLLERSVAPNGHVMVKIDIEGAEYQLLEEAVKSKIFCRLVQEQGVRVDIIGEYHDDSILGSDEPRKRWEEVVKGEETIRKCGVNYRVIRSIIPNW